MLFLLETTALLFLLEVVTLLLLLDMLFCSSFLTYYSACFVQLVIQLLLLNVIAFLASHCYSIPFAWCHCSSCSTMLLFVHLDTSLMRPSFCYSLFLLFQIGIPLLHFLKSFKKLSKFKFFKSNLEGENFFFYLCLLTSFFNYPCFWEMVVGNVFVCCVGIIWTLYT
jgi:hypothetical protein